jgi:hypothetical protein
MGDILDGLLMIAMTPNHRAAIVKNNAAFFLIRGGFSGVHGGIPSMNAMILHHQ